MWYLDVGRLWEIRWSDMNVGGLFRVYSSASELPLFSPQQQLWHFIMPPRPTTLPPLNDVEKMLMQVTAWIAVATKYRKDHPNQMDPNFGINLLSEAVHHEFSFIIFCLIIFRDMSLTFIKGFDFQREASTMLILPLLPLWLKPNC